LFGVGCGFLCVCVHVIRSNNGFSVVWRRS
jgi:hypothetical protein